MRFGPSVLHSSPPEFKARLVAYAWLAGVFASVLALLALWQGWGYAGQNGYFESNRGFLAADFLEDWSARSVAIGLIAALAVAVALELAARLKLWWGVGVVGAFALLAALTYSRWADRALWGSTLTTRGLDFPAAVVQVETVVFLVAVTLVATLAAAVAAWRLGGPRPSAEAVSIRSLVIAWSPAVLVVVGSLLWANTSAPPAQPGLPNVIWVTWDSVRADHLSVYGRQKPTSPFLEELAEQSVVFESAYSQFGWTRPSYASMLTSRWPWLHGSFPLQEESLPETLQSLGYRTLALVQNPNVDAELGFSQGFQSYVRFRGVTPPSHVTDRAIEELGDALGGDRPVFAFVHLLDPHYPYATDNEFRKDFVDPDLEIVPAGETSDRMHDHKDWAPDDPERARLLAYFTQSYDAEIRRSDEEFRRLFAFLEEQGAVDDSLIVFNSDHGEEFTEHGRFGHSGGNIYRETVHVPLIIRYPDRLAEAPRRVERMAQGLDLFPTILGVIGAPIPETVAGRDLRAPVPSEEIVMTRSASGFKAAIRDARYTLHADFETGRLTLFDRTADSFEQNPLESDEVEGVADLRAAALEWFSAYRRRQDVGTEESPTLRRSLEALGYVQ